MDTSDHEAQYFIFENRLNSFQGPQPVAKRRISTTAHSRTPKTLTWPHQSPSAYDLARAGFFFNPQPSNPDNVKCFLCHKDLDGWEEDDDPLQEHLKHSGSCGWAVCAAIERELGDVINEDPRLPYLLDARKATFADRWPYESKRGWKCKTKQLAEAGWLYTPTLESDDKTTCAYCQLALDGWEAGDKPMDEHQRRSPNCPFFTLISKLPAPKKTRGRGARPSKASRLSVQSVATTISDEPSTVDFEESFMTATSSATHTGRKGPRGRKAASATATGRGRKTRVKKDEPIGILSDTDADPIQEMEPMEPPVVKRARGKKRGSDETEAEEPAKKRAAHVRISDDVGNESMQPQSSNYAMFDAKMPEADEDEIEAELRALEKDMGVESEIQVPKRGRKAGGARKVSKQTTRKGKEAAAPEPEAKPEPELDNVSEPQSVPKSKAKAHGRGKKPVQAAQAAQAEEPHEISIISIASSHTTAQEPIETAVPPKRKRGRPSKQSIEAQRNAEKKAAAAAAARDTAISVTITPAPLSQRISLASVEDLPAPVEEKPKKRSQTRILPPPIPTVRAVVNSPPQQAQSQPPPARSTAPPVTPRAVRIAPVTSARQAVLSPSQSPQSSDAENRPPSTKQAVGGIKGHVVLAPVQSIAAVSTPVRTGSPSKRNNVLGGLRSQAPWTEVDVDDVFLELENEAGGNALEGMLLRPGAELSTPEKAMTVEEFILHNACQAERMLKEECEAMVSMFERQGTRAMQTLEALVAEE